jgi:hypothetical protein
LTCYTPEAIRSALHRVENELVTSWSEEQIEQAINALAAFCSEECIVGTQSAEEALERSGIMNIPFTLRQYLFASIAESMLGAFWFGVRTATNVKPTGEVEMTQYDTRVLREHAEELCRLFRMPPWRRRATVLWRRALRALGLRKES